MKAAKFISQDEPNIISCIRLLTCEVNANNNVLITWEWPRDNNIKMVVVFQTLTGKESLAELLANENSATIITKGMDGEYNKPLECEKAVFKLFPACFGKNGEVLILNQQKDNTTDVLFAQIPVYYSIVYKSIPFSNLQRVSIKIEIVAKNHFMPIANVEDLLIYEKTAGGYTLRYPIDENAVNGGLTLYVKKNEEIYLKPKAPYGNIVSLHKEV